MKKGLSIFLFAGLAAFLWVAANSSNEPLEDDSFITALAPEPNPSLNGILHLSYLLEDANSPLADHDKSKLRKHVHLKAWDDIFVKEILDDLEPHITNIELATNSPYIRYTPADDPTLLPIFSQAVQLNHQIILKSMAHLKRSEINEAISSLTLSLDFSNQIRQSQDSTLINYMIGDTMLFHSYRWAHHLVASTSLTNQQYKRILNKMATVGKFNRDGFDQVFVGEYLFSKAIFANDYYKKRTTLYGRWQLWLNKWLSKWKRTTDQNSSEVNIYGDSISLIEVLFSNYMFDSNAFANYSARKFYTLANETQKYCHDIEVQDELPKHNWLDFLFPKSMNKTFEQFSDVYMDYFYRRCLSYTYFNAVHASVAASAHEEKYGNTIISISSLVPEFLQQEPIDYMTGGALNYSPEDQWFFGAGVEQNNTNGSENGIFNSPCSHDEGCWLQPTVRFEPILEEIEPTISDEKCRSDSL